MNDPEGAGGRVQKWPNPSLTQLKYLRKKVKKVKSLSRVQLFVTPWTVAHQATPKNTPAIHEYNVECKSK